MTISSPRAVSRMGGSVEWVVKFVCEIRVGFGGIIRPQCRPLGFRGGLLGFRNTLPSSIAGTARYPVRIRTGIARNSKCHKVVASWLHQARFGILLHRFAQELGNCLFVTRSVPRLCIAQRSSASVQST